MTAVPNMPRNRSGRRTPTLSASSVTLPADIFPAPDEITLRAHALLTASGRRTERIADYWRQAEQELLDRGARRALAPRSRRRQ
jgi:hypothetical protein